MNNNNQENKIVYPIEWKYRVIGNCENSLRKAVDDVCGNREYLLKSGNKSRTGKFLSVEASLIVVDEVDRNNIFIRLKSHIDIKMVL